VEVRQLDAFVAVATELHFGRAASGLYMSQSTLSELVRRLERELGTPLLVRTTRHVSLTDAGAELLARSKLILDEVAAAAAAVRRVANGEGGTVRLGVTPPVAPVLAPHLIDRFAKDSPNVELSLQRMWLPDLVAAIAAGEVDVAITCGRIPESDGVVGEVFCGERLLVALRPDDPQGDAESVTLSQLSAGRLGAVRESLFPAWALSQRQALEAAGVSPAMVELDDTDLAAARWLDQPDVDWIMLIGSLAAAHPRAVIRPVEPPVIMPFTLQWAPERAHSTAVARFVHAALGADPPSGWVTQPGHFRHPVAPSSPGTVA
jgi:DNA-binding transcriptional LysR family regulator